jgi:hypothetical protein
MNLRHIGRRVAQCALIAMAAVNAATAAAAEANPSLGDDALRPADAASALPAGEWTAIRRVIDDQLAALRDGDAPRAFAFASAAIREQFHDAPTFLRMVQDSYGVLLAARYAEFLEGAVIDGHTLQPLRLVMGDDTVLVALYEMQRDASGAWRIAGCVIVPSTVRST